MVYGIIYNFSVDDNQNTEGTGSHFTHFIHLFVFFPSTGLLYKDCCHHLNVAIFHSLNVSCNVYMTRVCVYKYVCVCVSVCLSVCLCEDPWD